MNIFKRKKKYRVKGEFEVIQSCEDADTVYLELPDGLRLIIRNGEYVGWYLPEVNDGKD